jgi:hypothetical protein
VERGVFPKPEVVERLRKFVLVKLFINDPKPGARSPEWREMLEKRFGTSAIPLYVTLDGDGKEIGLGTLSFPGGGPDAFAGRMTAFLDAAL